MKKNLTIAVDLYGCPNRCMHCWLGHMPNRIMEADADQWIVDCFRPYYENITFYSWLREPDYAPDYRERWQRDRELSIHAMPQRFELASFWRLVRDPVYVEFLSEEGVKCVQLTFFGMKDTTDRYIGRKGAFAELLKATDILLENGISPRWQVFLNEENRPEAVDLLHLSNALKLPERTASAGGSFRFFVHAGSCDGENMNLYPIRICRNHVPEELVPYFLNYEDNLTEREWCRQWQDNTSHVELHPEDDLVLYVSNTYDLFFNFTHMKPEWRIGNLKKDPMEELIRRIQEEDTPALREARRIPLGELVERYGDENSEKLFEEADYRMYLLNRHLEEAA